MLLVALVVILATTVGVVADRRSVRAVRAQKLCLTAMLYGLVPYVAFVNFAHLKLSAGGAIGLGAAYAGLAIAGALAALVARRLGLDRPATGALIIAVLVVNTAYLGYPVAVALLGSGALSTAVVYDQVVSTPLVFTVGFAIGAAFGSGGAATAGGRRRHPAVALLRNPPLWAALAGLIGGPAVAPHALVSVGHKVVDAFLVLGFFAVGVALSSERRAEGAPLFQRPDLPVLYALALRFTVNPATLGILALAGVGVPSAYFLQAAMPSGINGLIVAHAYGLDQRLIATTIVWGTIAALIVGVLAYVA